MSASPDSDPRSLLIEAMEDSRRALLAASSSEDWEVVKRQAHRHGLAGVLAHLYGDRLPVEQKLWRKEVAATQMVAHHRRLRQLQSIAEALDAEGIRFVVLKGPVLGERYFNPPFLKVCGDLDLLVDEANLERAGRCLEDIGLREEICSLPWWVWRRGSHHIAFKPSSMRPEWIPVELHFRLLGQHSPISSMDLLDRAELWVGANGLQVRVLDRADEAIFLANHAARHLFARLAWLYDALVVFRTLSMAERDQALALARKAGAITALSAANRAAMEFFHEPLLADLPDFAAWPAFRSQAAGVKLIDNKMRWRERILSGWKATF